jgi:rod shape-determining protein MreB
VISERAAEDLKVAIGAAGHLEAPISAEVQGRVVATGERASAVVSSDDIAEAIADHLRAMVDGVAACLADSPPEFAQDALFEGIHLLGGGALVAGFAEQLSDGTSVPVHTVDQPLHVVIEGAGRCLDDLGRLSALFASAER